MRDAVGNFASVLVLGGGSDIAAATLRQLVAGRTRRVILGARRPDSVSDIADELRDLGAEVEVMAFDAEDTAVHSEQMAKVFAQGGDIDLVISAFGILGDQDSFDADPAAAADAVRTNFGGQVSALLSVAAEMRRQGHGNIVVLSSVAGERVRKDNAVYGATKAGLDGFAQGLSDRLAGSGVDVCIVRPGFVHSSMTEGMDPAPFSTTPEAVATDIVNGLRRGSAVVWSPAILRWVFTVMRHLPRPVWRIVSNRGA
jgi:decaprenylphospho-beta-D-erythro-pentofuranosid-2-ulose 2-reductase